MRAGGEGRESVRSVGIDVRIDGDEVRMQRKSFFEVGEERIGFQAIGEVDRRSVD